MFVAKTTSREQAMDAVRDLLEGRDPGVPVVEDKEFGDMLEFEFVELPDHYCGGDWGRYISDLMKNRGGR